MILCSGVTIEMPTVDDGSTHCKGEACLIRYADDFVCAFEYERDAKASYKVLELRLGKFGLKVAPDKTRVISFNRKNKPGATRFDFLGFEFYWGKDLAGRDHLKRRTSRKKLRNSLHSFTEWCRENRNLRLNLLFDKLNQKLRGYFN
jgi:RNA-directed DNA polymerase